MRKYDHLRNKNGMMETNCEHCAKPIEFKDFRNHKGTPTKPRFCSVRCAADSQRKPRNCKWCNKIFYATSKGSKIYCNNQCFNAERKERTKKNCKTCQKTFWTKKDQKHCSRACAAQNRNRYTTPEYWRELKLHKKKKHYCKTCDRQLNFEESWNLTKRKAKKYCDEQCRHFYQKMQRDPSLCKHRKNESTWLET